MLHINGSVRLLELRGVDGLMNTPSLTTFRSWRDQIVRELCEFGLNHTLNIAFTQILGCIYRRVPVPLTILRLSERLAATSGSSIETFSNHLTRLMAKLANIRCQTPDGPSHYSNSTILNELFSIRTRLSIWLSQASLSCTYKSFAMFDEITVGQDSKLRPYRSLCHRYPDLSSALMWNNYRVTRILVCDMILSQLHPLATMNGDSSEIKEVQTKCSEMRKEMRNLAYEICDSVPYILGVLDPHTSSSKKPSDVKSSAGGFVLLFPLSFAVVVDDHPSPLSEWILECLRIIAGVMGIHQAIVLQQYLPNLCGQYSWADKF